MLSLFPLCGLRPPGFRRLVPTLVWVLTFHFATGAVRLTPGFLNPHLRSPRPCVKPLRPLLALSPVWLKRLRRGTAVPKLLVLPLSLLVLLPVTGVLKDPKVLSLLPAPLLPLQLTGLPSLVFCAGLSASTGLRVSSSYVTARLRL